MSFVKENRSEQEQETREIFAEPLGNEIDSTPTPQSSQAKHRWLAGKSRLIVGVGVCVAIAVGGKLLISNAGRYNAKSQVLSTTPQVSRTIKAMGTVVAQELLVVLPQASDVQIKQVLVKAGDRVKAGQLMAVFDDSVLQAQVKQAQGRVKSSQAVVFQKQAAVRQANADLNKAQAALVKGQAQLNAAKAEQVKAEAEQGEAQANLDKARNERDRYQFLATQGAISLQDLESRSTEATAFGEQLRSAGAEISVAQAEINSAQAELGSVQAELGAAQAKVSMAQADLESAQANVSSSLAELQQLQTQRERTLLRAPAHGIVMERIAQVGDVTSFDRKLFSLVRDGSFQLQIKIEEYQLPGLRIGAPVQVTSDSDKRIRLQGTVSEIAPVVDLETHQPIVRIALPPSTLLRSGMVLRAAIASAYSDRQESKGATGAVLPQSKLQSTFNAQTP